MSNATTSWANRTKAAVSSAPTKQLVKVGGGGSLEPIVAYYQFRELGPKAGPKSRQLLAGTEIVGTYDGSFKSKGKTKTGRVFESVQFKVRTADGIVAIPSCTQLKNRLAKVPQGAEVAIKYNGMSEYTNKQTNELASAHTFDVSASEVIE